MKKKSKVISMLFCVVLFWGIIANAAEIAAVMNAYTCSGSLVLFVKDQGQAIEGIYLGNDEAKEFKAEDTGPIRTVVVLDNSLSINKKYREDIKTFLTDLVAARDAGDTFTIATFAEDLTYLAQESDDYLEIKTQIDALRFEDQDSYFTNVLYKVMDDISDHEEIKYTRVIVIADGVDNEPLGYTDDELNRRIQTVKVPIYAVGCSSKGNAENLKKMFALSRLSNGKSYLLDDVSGTEILQDIERDTDVIKICVVPQDGSCDGTEKAVRVSFGDNYCTTEMAMPFKAVKETIAETESETEKESIKETVPVTGSAEIEVTEAEDKGLPAILFVVLGILAISIVVLIIVLIKRKKPKEVKRQIDLSGIGHSRETAFRGLQQMDRGSSGGDTELLNKSNWHDPGDRTNILGADNMIRLLLQDMDDPSKTFEYPLRDRILIGRDPARCQVAIDYSTYVSSIHCEIIAKGGSLYVRDGGGEVIASTNGTFVNDKRVAPELPLPSGSILKLGKIRLRVTYK